MVTSWAYPSPDELFDLPWGECSKLVGLDFTFTPEGAAVLKAFAFEKQGNEWIPDPNHPAYDGYQNHHFHPEYSYHHFYEDAAKQWAIASLIAGETAKTTAKDPPPTSADAAVRAAAYEARYLADKDIATGKAIRRSPSFHWPAIPQGGASGPTSGIGSGGGGGIGPVGPAGSGSGPTKAEVADVAGGIGFTALFIGIGYLGWMILAGRGL